MSASCSRSVSRPHSPLTAHIFAIHGGSVITLVCFNSAVPYRHGIRLLHCNFVQACHFARPASIEFRRSTASRISVGSVDPPVLFLHVGSASLRCLAQLNRLSWSGTSVCITASLRACLESPRLVVLHFCPGRPHRSPLRPLARARRARFSNTHARLFCVRHVGLPRT